MIRSSDLFSESTQFVASRPSGTCALEKIALNVVHAATGVKQEEIFGKSRRGDTAFCRHLVAYISRRTSSRSYDFIAEALKREDHTTAMNSCVRIEAFMRQHPFHHAFVRMMVERTDEIGVLNGRTFRK